MAQPSPRHGEATAQQHHTKAQGDSASCLGQSHSDILAQAVHELSEHATLFSGTNRDHGAGLQVHRAIRNANSLLSIVRHDHTGHLALTDDAQQKLLDRAG
jgi:hypothetical protein